MHELSLCRSIFKIVDRARGERDVQTVHLTVGQLRQVVPQTLEHCWQLVTAETPLRDSRLDIDHVAIELHCGACCARTSALHRLVLTCSACGSGEVAVVRGEELMVTSMDLRGGEGDG